MGCTGEDDCRPDGVEWRLFTLAMRERRRSCRAAASIARCLGALSSAIFMKRSSLSAPDTFRFARPVFPLRASSKSEDASLELAMCREDRMLVTVLWRESIGLFACGMDAVASLALELSESSSSSGGPSACRPAIGVGRADPGWRWGWVGVVAGAFLRA